MDELELARTRLFDALVAGVSPLAPWRVLELTPTNVAAPTVYIDTVELSIETLDGSVRFIGATFPVVLVADGSVHAQITGLERVLARVWDAASTVGEPVDSRPVGLDVGGPNLRAHVVRVGMIITARTLCASTLVTTGGAT